MKFISYICNRQITGNLEFCDVCLFAVTCFNKQDPPLRTNCSENIWVCFFNHKFIFFQSFLKNNAVIVSQYPTPEDAVDFLRLLTDHESDTIICLNPLHEIKSVSKNKSCLWIYYRDFLCLEISSILSWVLLNLLIIHVAEFFYN